MKIVFLSRFQNKSERGAEIFVNELSSRLSLKHEVDVFTGSDADSLDKVLKGKYDVVIPINGRMQSLEMSLGRLFKGYKLLISGHSGIGRDDIWNIVIAKPNVFVSLTDHMAAWAKKWAWGSKVVTIPNGIDLNKFLPNGKKIDINLPKPIILSVGVLSWYKHHERVIQAAKEIGNTSVLIVGEGSEKERLEELGKETLGKRFKITSFDYKDMPKVYRSCDLFSLPSWDREAFGIVYLEALASGLGVVAPDDVPRREIVGDGGLFTNVENIEEYARTLKNALSIDWIKKARQQAEKFSWEVVTDKYETLMLSLIG